MEDACITKKLVKYVKIIILSFLRTMLRLTAALIAEERLEVWVQLPRTAFILEKTWERSEMQAQ